MRIEVPPTLTALYTIGYQTPDISGGWGNWASAGPSAKCRHDPDRLLPNGERDIASVCTPVIGPYDSADPALCEYHILLALASGLDAFVVSWNGGGRIADTLRLWFTTAEKLHFKLAFHFRTADDLNKAGEFFQSAAYLHFNHKPVAVCPVGVEFPGFQGLTVREIQDHVQSPEPTDSLIPAPPNVTESGEVEKEFWDRVESADQRGNLGFVSALVHPGFDDRACQDAPKVVSRRQGETYAAAWEAALRHDARLAVVRSWNHHSEGSAIEPVKENVLHKQAALPGWGYRELLATREYAARFKREKLWPLPALFLPERLYHLRKSDAPYTRGDRVRLYLLEGDYASATLALEQAGV